MIYLHDFQSPYIDDPIQQKITASAKFLGEQFFEIFFSIREIPLIQFRMKKIHNKDEPGNRPLQGAPQTPNHKVWCE